MQFNDVEEVQSLIESASEALAAVSQANRTLIQARQTVKGCTSDKDDHCTTGQQLRQHVTRRERQCFFCRGPHLARDRPDRNKPTGHGFEGIEGQHVREERELQRQKSCCGDHGYGVHRICRTWNEFVRSVARRRGFNESCDDYNPFDESSLSEKLCPEETSLSDWNQWRRHLIEVHLSVLHGNILASL